jgi:hypothetical protein
VLGEKVALALVGAVSDFTGESVTEELATFLNWVEDAKKLQ